MPSKISRIIEPPQDSLGEHWQYLVDFSRDEIAGIEPEAKVERIPPESKAITPLNVTKKWHESLLRTHASLEPARDGAKTFLILADTIAEKLEAAIETAIEERGLGDVWQQATERVRTWPASPADLPQEPIPKADELRRVLVDICAGMRGAANQTADLLVDNSRQWLDMDADMWDVWLNRLVPHGLLEAITEEIGIVEEWVVLSTPDAGVYGPVEALRVAQGFYTTPSRTLEKARDWDWQRIEVQYQVPYVVVYDGPITQLTTLKPMLDFLTTGEAGKKPTLIIIADEVSGEALEALHTQSAGSFNYLVLPTPPYHHPDRREYLEAIAHFAGATLRPEAEVPLVRLGGEDEEHDESLWLTVTVPSEEEGESQVQPDHLGKKLQRVLSNRQRTLLIRKYGEPDDEKIRERLQDWPRHSETALWQVQVISTLSVGSSESMGREEWQKQATAAVAALAQFEEARHSGLVAGGGAALVWAQGRLDFDPPADVAEERLPLIEAGWQALRSALNAPLTAIVSKAGIQVDSEKYRELMAEIQAADAPVVGYSLVRTDETPPGYRLQIDDMSVTGHADPARTIGLLVLNAVTVAPRVLAIRSFEPVGTEHGGGSDG